jgi:F-type H+-transporting ATPase subunit epsilon
METLTLHFVTPEATFFSGPASMVEAPGTLGEFGVLPGHMHFISTLRPGIVTIHETEDKATRVFVAGGIAEVNPVSCTILAERVIDLATLTRADAEARLTRAKAALDETLDETAKNDAAREIELAETLVAALS